MCGALAGGWGSRDGSWCEVKGQVGVVGVKSEVRGTRVVTASRRRVKIGRRGVPKDVCLGPQVFVLPSLTCSIIRLLMSLLCC